MDRVDRKKRGSITCRTDRANEANKMFIIWLCWLFRFWEGDRELEVRTATYGPGIDQSQHVKSVSHIIILVIKYTKRLLLSKLLCLLLLCTAAHFSFMPVLSCSFSHAVLTVPVYFEGDFRSSSVGQLPQVRGHCVHRQRRGVGKRCSCSLVTDGEKQVFSKFDRSKR